jgi:NTE family protein
MTVTQLVPGVARDANADLAIMLTGGGARAAYQVGLLKGIARHFPNLRIDILTGVSAGAINAVWLAAHNGTLVEKARQLEAMWMELSCRSIYKIDWKALLPFRSAIASILPKKNRLSRARPHGFLDSSPLRNLLCRSLGIAPWMPIPGIEENLRYGNLSSLALMTLDYSTGQTVRWVQGRYFDVHEGPNRRTEPTQFTIEHVMASSALPFVFPAVRIGSEWHGDGGIRLAAPLSSAVHLGASRIIAMSTGNQRSPDEPIPLLMGYPPAAQILNQLVNAIFIDAIDEDVARMQRMNEMLEKMRPEDRDGLKPIDLLVLRPSADLGKLATDCDRYLPRELKLLMRAIGVRETESADSMSLLLFEPVYTKRLIEAGEADVEKRIDEIRAFLGEDDTQISAAG